MPNYDIYFRGKLRIFKINQPKLEKISCACSTAILQIEPTFKQYSVNFNTFSAVVPACLIFLDIVGSISFSLRVTINSTLSIPRSVILVIVGIGRPSST